MPQSIDYIGAVYKQIVKLLSERRELVPALIRPGDFIHYADTRAGDPRPAPAKPADYPAVYVKPIGQGGDDLFSDSVTFDRESSTFSTETGEWPEPQRQTFQVLILSRDNQFLPVSQVRAECLTALRKAGRRLGLGQWCDMIRARWDAQLTAKYPECFHATRWVIDLKIDFVLTFEGQSELIP